MFELNTLYSAIGVITVLYLLYLLLKEIGNKLPILEMILVLAGFQWIIGPVIDFNTEAKHFKYFMYVDEETYMSFVSIAFLAFCLPVLLFQKKSLNFKVSGLNNSTSLTLVILGIVFTTARGFLPSSLSFIGFLLQNLMYIGAGFILFDKNSKYKYLAYFVIVYLLYDSLSSGFFHALLLWSTFLFFLWALGRKISWLYKIAALPIFFLIVVFIQTVKFDFRDSLEKNQDPFNSFIALVQGVSVASIFEDEEQINQLNVRLNQGWIISSVIKTVPKYEPYANGETVVDAVFASILPRFLNPNKKQAGGVENFERFTGLQLGQNTSMGISIIGEAYANFGRIGGIIFMFFWGLFLTLFWNYLMKLCEANYLLLFFIPLIFLQVVKAETELVVVLNHLVKSSILVWGLFKFLPDLKPDYSKLNG